MRELRYIMSDRTKFTHYMTAFDPIERNFPPLVYVENAKISVYVESPNYFNIFS